LYCGKCGAEVAEGAEQCGACGALVTSTNDSPGPAVFTPSVAKSSFAYAGFWLRTVAFVIDGLLVLVIIAGPMIYLMAKNIGPDASLQKSMAFAYGGTPQALAINLLIEMAYWLYFASLESSVWQATVGKKLLGLYVTDLDGKRITFARASGRFLGLSFEHLTLFIGCFMAGFTSKKQALHDMIASCLVLKRK
jgi:uncharacterized RDD family membrane protein YckC